MEPRHFVMDSGTSDPSVLTRQDKHIFQENLGREIGMYLIYLLFNYDLHW